LLLAATGLAFDFQLITNLPNYQILRWLQMEARNDCKNRFVDICCFQRQLLPLTFNYQLTNLPNYQLLPWLS